MGFVRTPQDTYVSTGRRERIYYPNAHLRETYCRRNGICHGCKCPRDREAVLCHRARACRGERAWRMRPVCRYGRGQCIYGDYDLVDERFYPSVSALSLPSGCAGFVNPRTSEVVFIAVYQETHGDSDAVAEDSLPVINDGFTHPAGWLTLRDDGAGGVVVSSALEASPFHHFEEWLATGWLQARVFDTEDREADERVRTAVREYFQDGFVEAVRAMTRPGFLRHCLREIPAARLDRPAPGGETLRAQLLRELAAAAPPPPPLFDDFGALPRPPTPDFSEFAGALTPPGEFAAAALEAADQRVAAFLEELEGLAELDEIAAPRPPTPDFGAYSTLSLFEPDSSSSPAGTPVST
jgi:hypothetical protein